MQHKKGNKPLHYYSRKLIKGLTETTRPEAGYQLCTGSLDG